MFCEACAQAIALREQGLDDQVAYGLVVVPSTKKGSFVCESCGKRLPQTQACVLTTRKDWLGQDC